MRSSVDPRWGIAIALVLGFAGTGCNDYYRVTMRPVGDGIERELYLASFDSDHKPKAVRLRPDDFDRLTRIYGVRPDSSAPYRAKARFAAIPEDFDNRGFYRLVQTPLGSAGFYLERFGGPSHVSAILARPIEAADSLHRLTRTWFGAELARHRGWPALRSYLDTELRTVLRDYSSAAFEDRKSVV